MFLRTTVCRIFPPIVVFESYEGIGQKAQIDFSSKKNKIKLGRKFDTLLERGERDLTKKLLFASCETDCNMATWPLMCQIACIFLKMTPRSFGAPQLMIELRLHMNQKVSGI